jgi:predicted transcriptional regulator
MKTAISLPDDLYRAAEQAATRLGLSRSELYQRAIAAFLKRHNEQVVTDALNEVYAGEHADTVLDPALQHLQNLSLPREEW